jgi:hypothetical protein
MIELGSCDADVSQAACDAYLKELEAITRLPLSAVKGGPDKIVLKPFSPDPQQPMSVAAIQHALKERGFFPGGKVDGICGYRTMSAIRLFQEYLRSVEKQESIVPDGRCGPISQQHLKRWIDGKLETEWAPTIERWRAGTLGDTEYTAWLALLGEVKKKYTAAPTRMLQLVNAFAGKSDTRKVAQWDFDPKQIHFIGVRRNDATNKFDDIFVLLMKGLVFKFQGSTEPGASKNPAGAPFLVQGQHDYHFGWHQSHYLALKPEGRGVLVVRSKGDVRLDDADLDKGLEANTTINVHWGGKGMSGAVDTWSEGCQVINGSVYIDEKGGLITCSPFVALNNGEVAKFASKTRGAYNVLVDLVTALGSDVSSGLVKYTLLVEPDLELSPALAKVWEDSRAAVRKWVGKV